MEMFLSKKIFYTGQAGTGLYIQIADLNGDGWKEIVVPEIRHPYFMEQRKDTKKKK